MRRVTSLKRRDETPREDLKRDAVIAGAIEDPMQTRQTKLSQGAVASPVSSLRRKLAERHTNRVLARLKPPNVSSRI